MRDELFRDARGAIAMLHDDELVSARERQRPQQHGFDDGEERGVGADTECERQYRRGGKAGLEPEQPERAADILSEHDEDFPSWAASAAGMNERLRTPGALEHASRRHSMKIRAHARRTSGRGREAQIGQRRAVEIALGGGRQPSTEPFGPTRFMHRTTACAQAVGRPVDRTAGRASSAACHRP